MKLRQLILKNRGLTFSLESEACDVFSKPGSITIIKQWSKDSSREEVTLSLEDLHALLQFVAQHEKEVINRKSRVFLYVCPGCGNSIYNKDTEEQHSPWCPNEISSF